MATIRLEKPLHYGYTLDENNVRTNYVVDDVDCLSCEIRDYSKGIPSHPFSWLELMDTVRDQEREGIRYIISIGDAYYETIDEGGE